MNGILLLIFGVLWLAIDIFAATKMANIEDPEKLQRMRLLFILVNIVVIVTGLSYLYIYYSSPL